MRLLSRVCAGAFLVAVALVPRPGIPAGATHPLDPAAPAGPVPTQNIFERVVPLLDRDTPDPSFTDESDQPEALGSAPLAEAMDDEVVDQGSISDPTGGEP